MDHFSLTGFSASNMLSCIADGEDIYQIDYMGNRRLIGKTKAAYDVLESTTTEYYNKLVELGVIPKQKTPEEMMADMQNVMQGMLQTISDLKNEVKEMQKDGREKGACRAGEDVPKREPKRSSTKGGSGDQRDGE